MKTAILLAGVIAALPLAARPAVADAPTCAVTIARAPDDVRAIVEQWVRAEPRCTTALEVRIVATEGGLYLLARDEHGRVRERVVPDAQSAGVLIASWAAADAADAAPVTSAAPAALAAPAASATIVSAEPPPERTGEGAPGAASVTAAIALPPREPGTWLGLGAMFGSGGGGLRGELDLRTRRSATLGIAASISTWDSSGDSVAMVDTTDVKLLGYASLGVRRGRWQLRAGLGAGIVYTRATMYEGEVREAAGVFPAGEISVRMSRDLTARWQLYAGPIVSVYAQMYELEGSQTIEGTLREPEGMFVIGLRHLL